MNNPEKSVELEINQIAINIVAKHLPTYPRRGLERSIEEALSAERKKVEELKLTISNLDNKGVAWIAEVQQLKSELTNWKSLAGRMKGLLEYHSGSKIVQSLFSEYEKLLAEYERMGKE